ncbi:hypothetical protein [Sphingomonas sp. ACRSK]|uniref:hypothetical protein n=1 Tax=Sphingomonas sp. ACRSK TaxID=2918213 RepID=UPI001EF62240|nr:hypothetical protein [Sphingomonas sp. ACRSK]MCG7348853.1 hypothetical protein [Sphingomonas sp. ACRSK]
MAEVICLTGKGNENGVLVTRPEWEARITAAGHRVTDKAQNCTVLVASRHDTSKAVNARARGARVETYEWLSQLLIAGGARDTTFDEPFIPAKPIDTTEMEGSELWGLF